jgi:F-type H+-transporting ATPase subunit gamma
MANLKVLKNRIASVKSTRKITKAMQMVAAAKLRRAQEAAEMSRPYTERFNAVMAGLASTAGGEGAPKLLSGTGSDNVQLLVVMTSERGLCGGFNGNIAKKAKAHAADLLAAGKTVKIITVGKKGRDAMKRDFGDYFIAHVDLSEVKRIGYDNAQDIARDVLGRFDAAEFDVATIFYAKFVNVVTQMPRPTMARSMTTSQAKRPFWLTCCRAQLRPKSLRPCWKTAHPSKALVCRPWTTRPATLVK